MWAGAPLSFTRHTHTHTYARVHKQRANPAVCVHSQAERQQRQQGLLGGPGSELRQRLDQFVHHGAQVALQLLPPLLHKLGILRTERQQRRLQSEPAGERLALQWRLSKIAVVNQLTPCFVCNASSLRAVWFVFQSRRWVERHWRAC